MNIDTLILMAVTNLEFEPRFDYSGRGMYGRKCFGFVASGHAMLAYSSFIKELADLQINLEELRDVLDYVTDVRWDNMGLDAIIYFPTLQIDEPDGVDDSEDDYSVDEI